MSVVGPRLLGMFPLSTVLYPHAELPLHVFEPRYRALVGDCLESDRSFGVVMIERGSEVGGGDQRSSVGTLALIVAAAAQPDGRWLLVARGVERIKVTQWLADDPYPLAMVEPIGTVDDGAGDGACPYASLLAHTLTRVRRTRALLSELGDHPPLGPDADLGDDAEEQMWRLCAAAPINLFDRQRLLAFDDPFQRLSLLIELCDEMGEDMTRMLGGASRPDPDA